MDRETRLKRLHFRAHHRGTREADMMIGGYFDAYSAGWSANEIDLFEALLEEQDVDIMAWALGTQSVPARWEGSMMQAMRDIDYVAVAK
ncbi:FAD assembly factor SdhE [Sphingomonas sp. EC-HK361]|uniref:FAD assembly factor SdhE n=1 Tax=Sphingomonas sp. EC-HK361 TaxID=2038397 RepID=UPI00125EEB63|nr:succinate dehydrogenase assembly factor 2 [Sphingomonas sp. EC-HK361]